MRKFTPEIKRIVNAAARRSNIADLVYSIRSRTQRAWRPRKYTLAPIRCSAFHYSRRSAVSGGECGGVLEHLVSTDTPITHLTVEGPLRTEHLPSPPHAVLHVAVSERNLLAPAAFSAPSIGSHVLETPTCAELLSTNFADEKSASAMPILATIVTMTTTAERVSTSCRLMAIGPSALRLK